MILNSKSITLYSVSLLLTTYTLLDCWSTYSVFIIYCRVVVYDLNPFKVSSNLLTVALLSQMLP